LHSYTDPSPALSFTGAAQTYLDSLNGQGNNRTQVLAASLTSIEQVMQLAGIHHITVSPPLLAELAATPAAGWAGTAHTGMVIRDADAAAAGNGKLGAESNGTGTRRKQLLEAVVQDEALWRMAFTRAEGGRCETKLVQALNIFADVQDRLEEIVRMAEGAGGV
jgi:hypothetical protein